MHLRFLFPVDRSRSDIDVVELKRGTLLLRYVQARVIIPNLNRAMSVFVQLNWRANGRSGDRSHSGPSLSI
jgi:hypothetical protein